MGHKNTPAELFTPHMCRKAVWHGGILARLEFE